MKRWMIFFVLLPMIAKSQTIETIVGNGLNGCSGFGSAATSASIIDPIGCAFDKYGNFYFANQQCQLVCKVDQSGIVTKVAGTGILGFSGDGAAATTAKLNYPNDVAFDTAGNLYIADGMNYRIRKVDLVTGVISTVAGSGIPGFGGDGGHATLAQFGAINGICFDGNNNMYLSDAQNHRIRKVDGVTNNIVTYCGTGIAGFSGDGMPATNAQINTPFDLIVDLSGSIYFPDANNKRIRKINPSGIITTIAGTGIALYSGDGVPATSANVGAYKIAVDNDGNIYASDSNQRIRQINNIGIISTVSGTGIAGYSGDGGPATIAQVASPSGIAIDLCGNVYFGDVGNHRIRRITMPPILAIPAISITGLPSTMPIGSIATINATITNAGTSYLIRWMNKGVQFATTTLPTIAYTKGPGIDTITARVVSTASYGCYDSTTSAPHIVTVGSTGIVPMYAVGGVVVYPNPAHSVLTVSGAEVINSIAITNLLGQTLLTEEYDKSIVQVNIAHLPPGMYLLRVNEVYVQRFMKE